MTRQQLCNWVKAVEAEQRQLQVDIKTVTTEKCMLEAQKLLVEAGQKKVKSQMTDNAKQSAMELQLVEEERDNLLVENKNLLLLCSV